MKQKERYLIKVTYLAGPHKDKVYLMQKGGYVTSINDLQGFDQAYASEAICRNICNKMFINNEQDFAIERKQNNWNIEAGKKGKEYFQFIYWPQSFEPVRVDPETAKVDLQDLTRKELNSLLKDA